MKPRLLMSTVLTALLAFNINAFADEQTWREEFTELPGWTYDSANTSIILSADTGKLTTKSEKLTSLPVSVKFRIRPVEGNQTYHNVYLRLFTDANGNVNSNTYTLALTSFARKYFKISKGSSTLFYSGNDNGLLTGPENWHEITMVVEKKLARDTK